MSVEWNQRDSPLEGEGENLVGHMWSPFLSRPCVRRTWLSWAAWEANALPQYLHWKGNQCVTSVLGPRSGPELVRGKPESAAQTVASCPRSPKLGALAAGRVSKDGSCCFFAFIPCPRAGRLGKAPLCRTMGRANTETSCTNDTFRTTGRRESLSASRALSRGRQESGRPPNFPTCEQPLRFLNDWASFYQIRAEHGW